MVKEKHEIYVIEDVGLNCVTVYVGRLYILLLGVLRSSLLSSEHFFLQLDQIYNRNSQKNEFADTHIL